MKNSPPPAAAEAKPLYVPDFNYAVADSGKKTDVTVGIVAPQFSGDGEQWWRDYKADEISAEMVRQLRTSFESLLIAKGLRVSGPFDGLQEMTFPEKQKTDLVLYPEFDMVFTLVATAPPQPVAQQQQPQKTEFKLFDFGGNNNGGARRPRGCNVTVNVSGAVLLTIKEPMSNQKMWMKKLDLTKPAQELTFEGVDCEAAGTMTRGAHDTWAKANEEMYQNVMSSLDRYISAEELAMIKQQAQQLRENTRYGG